MRPRSRNRASSSRTAVSPDGSSRGRRRRMLLDEETIRHGSGAAGRRDFGGHTEKSLTWSRPQGLRCFLADLLRPHRPPRSTSSPSCVRQGDGVRCGPHQEGLDEPLEGKDVLVIEGICASGLSLSYLLRQLPTTSAGVAEDMRVSSPSGAKRPGDVTLHYSGARSGRVRVGYGTRTRRKAVSQPALHRPPRLAGVEKAHLLRL